MVAAAMALSMWSFLRAIDDEEARPRWWAFVFAATLGTSLLLKSLIGVVFPVAACVVYMAVTRQFGLWRRLRPLSGLLVILAIALPWHILATLRNPPYFDLTMHSLPGEYHGFLWFFVMNEQVLRFLNLRYPRDYNTVPRVWFWLFHFVWLFPWSVYFPAVVKLSFRPVDRAGKTRLLALCWTGFVLIFFTLLDHAGILFDALLSRAGVAVRIGNGGGRRVDQVGDARARRDPRLLRDRGRRRCGS